MARIEIDIEQLTHMQRDLLNELLDNQGVLFLHRDDPRLVPARNLAQLGIVELDGEDADEVAVELTEAATEWIGPHHRG